MSQNVFISPEAKAATCKLLDYAKSQRGFRSDAALSRRLAIASPTISKLRNGKLPLRSKVVLGLMDLCDLTHTQIREMVGEDVWRDFVWNGKEADPTVVVGQEKVILHPPQLEAALAAVEHLRTDGEFFLRAGQRSGKSWIAGDVARRMGLPHISVWAESWKTAELQISPEILASSGVSAEIHYHTLPPDADGTNTLVIIDEAMWVTNSHEMFRAFRERGIPVLVLSARGPEFERHPEWKDVPFRSYCTWELNPNVTRGDLCNDYRANSAAAKRDFEGWE